MKNLFQFLWKHRFFLLFLLLEVFALSLIISNHQYQKSRFFSASNSITGNILSVYNNTTSYFSLRKINQQLAEENAQLREMLETSKLILDTGSNFVSDTLMLQHYRYQQSKVLSNSFEKRNNYLIINKGASQGYATDMGVVGPRGVVGIINSVSENYSSVISVLHSRTSIGAKMKKSGYAGTVTWSGKDYRVGQLENIPSHVKIDIGDTIITSGYSFIFPEGIMIGTVKHVKEIAGKGFYKIDLNFSVEYNQLEYVYVIYNLMKEEEREVRKNNNE